MDHLSNNPNSIIDCLVLITFITAILNSVALVYAVIITINACIKKLPTTGLEIYWYLTLLIAILAQFFDFGGGIALYVFSSPALLLILRFNKSISNVKWLKKSLSL